MTHFAERLIGEQVIREMRASEELAKQNSIVDHPCQDQQPSNPAMHPMCRKDCPQYGGGWCGLIADVKACVDTLNRAPAVHYRSCDGDQIHAWQLKREEEAQQQKCLRGEHEEGPISILRVTVMDGITGKHLQNEPRFCRHCRCLYVPKGGSGE